MKILGRCCTSGWKKSAAILAHPRLGSDRLRWFAKHRAADAANERAFCAKDYGKGKTAKYRKKKTKGMRRKKNEKNKPQPQEPQAWITLLWHMGLRLPWMWRWGPRIRANGRT